MQVDRWLYLSSSLWGVPLCYNLFWKRIDPKNFLFTGTNNWIVLAFRWSVKCFFSPNPQIFLIMLAEKREEGKEEEHRQLQSIIPFTLTQKWICWIYFFPQITFNTKQHVHHLQFWFCLTPVVTHAVSHMLSCCILFCQRMFQLFVLCLPQFCIYFDGGEISAYMSIQWSVYWTHV